MHGAGKTCQRDTGEDSALTEFRERVRTWLAATTPALTSEFAPEVELQHARRFQAALFDAGLAGLTWPIEFGGQGLDESYQVAYEWEAREFDIPTRPLFVGLGMCGPTVLDLGTGEQRRRYLSRLLRGDEVWCQLFSEPSAGSDVASLRTRADFTDGTWTLNGQKIWTTMAHLADFGVVLARTSFGVPKHHGLTMFILDMRTPGIDVRPLRDMSGRARFNEVFLDQVVIPSENVLGRVDHGWSAAMTMLGHERVSVGTEVVPASDPLTFDSLAERARRYRRIGDPDVRSALIDLYLQEDALRLLNARLRQEADEGNPPGPRGSVAKLAGAMVTRNAVDVAGLVAGTSILGWPEDDTDISELSLAVVSAPGNSIAGGTNEIQRNIIGERVLGLPKEQAPQGDPRPAGSDHGDRPRSGAVRS